MSEFAKNEWHDVGTNKTFHFDDEGMFVDEEGKGPQKGFKNNDQLCDWLTSYVQHRMIEEGLVTCEAGGATIYYTPNALNQPEKLLVLICGSGRIMAGLWSVGVCAYAGLKAGSVLSMIEEARKRDMEVIVLNPNAARSYEHPEIVFKDLIIPANPNKVWIVGHSMGGSSTCNIISKNAEWVINHVMAFALTDGCESSIHAEGFKINKWAHIHGINWVRSKEEINKELQPSPSCQRRSACTNDHPLTTWKAFPYIWEWFDEHQEKSDEDFTGHEEQPKREDCNPQ